MIRVLHVTERNSDFQTQRSAASVSRDAGEPFQIISRSIGAGGNWRNLALAVLGTRAEARNAEIVHAWGETAFRAAAIAGASRLIYSPAQFPGRRSVRMLRAVMGYRHVHVVCPTFTLRRFLVENGVPLSRCHLIRPGVEFSRIRRRRDAALRAALGFAEEDHVFLACGESTRAAGHELAVWAASILHVLDERYKVLAWGRGDSIARVATMGRSFGQPNLLRLAEQRLGEHREFESLFPSVDSVLVTAHRPVTTLAIATCMAAGLPIVATVTPTVAELLEDRHTAMMVPPDNPRLLAKRVLDLRADAGSQWRLADTARTEAYQFFSHTRLLAQYRDLYRQVAADAVVEVTEPAPPRGIR